MSESPFPPGAQRIHTANLGPIRLPTATIERIARLRDVIAETLARDPQRLHLGGRITKAAATRLCLEAGLSALERQYRINTQE